MVKIEHKGAQELLGELRAPFVFLRWPAFKWATAKFLFDLGALFDWYSHDFDAQIYKPPRSVRRKFNKRGRERARRWKRN